MRLSERHDGASPARDSLADATPRQVGLDGLPRLAAELALRLAPPKVIYLQGPLGAGKTTLVRALLAQLGHDGQVPSPTFSLAESYDLPAARIHHFDLYRIEDPAELEFLAIRDCIDERSLLLFEWPEKAQDAQGRMQIPKADLILKLSHDPEEGDSRLISCHNAASED